MTVSDFTRLWKTLEVKLDALATAEIATDLSKAKGSEEEVEDMLLNGADEERNKSVDLKGLGLRIEGLVKA